VSGEGLPFENEQFDVVVSDNVIDHAQDPPRIVDELIRVLRRGGLLFFSVNTHHRIYDISSRLYGTARLLSVPVEIGPFADHTVHLPPARADRLLRRQELQWLESRHVRVSPGPPRHAGEWLKRVCFKNARFELMARRIA
jgi:SAM-dependent methyltransferase